MHILDAYPDSLGKLHGNLYNNFSWGSNKTHLHAWKNGETGFPLVDAGMRQMNETGYMHNRCANDCGYFFIKNIDGGLERRRKVFCPRIGGL